MAAMKTEKKTENKIAKLEVTLTASGNVIATSCDDTLWLETFDAIREKAEQEEGK
jgi:hypothetical protein